jgi:hypothetical protein
MVYSYGAWDSSLVLGDPGAPLGRRACGLLSVHEDDPDVEPLEGMRVLSFDDVDVLMRNRGLILELADGSEFQLTIVRSRA